MKIRVLVFSILTLLVLAVGYLVFQPKNPASPSITSSVQPSNTPNPVDIKASFTIITDKITRNFSNPKYHNQSPDVFIESQDPMSITVKKEGVTWEDFFGTLPMKLNNECLVTGDGERLCNDAQGTLRFYLNDQEDSDALKKSIKSGDKLRVVYISTWGEKSN